MELNDKNKNTEKLQKEYEFWKEYSREKLELTYVEWLEYYILKGRNDRNHFLN